MSILLLVERCRSYDSRRSPYSVIYMNPNSRRAAERERNSVSVGSSFGVRHSSFVVRRLWEDALRTRAKEHDRWQVCVRDALNCCSWNATWCESESLGNFIHVISSLTLALSLSRALSCALALCLPEGMRVLRTQWLSCTHTLSHRHAHIETIVCLRLHLGFIQETAVFVKLRNDRVPSLCRCCCVYVWVCVC